MSENGRRYVFRGHAIGVAAQFHRLGELTGLKHVVPALGAAVLPVTGGLSHGHDSNYDYSVDAPWKRSLVKVAEVDGKAVGTTTANGYHTEVSARIENLDVVEKLHIDLAELHMSSTGVETDPPEIAVAGIQYQGFRLGDVAVTVVLDDETLAQCPTKTKLAAFYAGQPDDFRHRNAWRFCTEPGAPAIREHHGYYYFSIVREIHLQGPQDSLSRIEVHGNKIVWPGFGRMYLGEVIVGDRERRLTMVRLAMGSDAGGDGSIGDAGTNGFPST